MLQVINVSKSHISASKEKIAILKNITFDVKEGEVCALVGPSGSGKTTLLGLCAGLDFPTEGNVILAGEELTNKNQNELALFRNHHVGFIFQNFQLIPTLTALENTLAPVELRGGKPPLKEAKLLLETVGLSHRLSHYPSQLSGGEQQRVAIARSFINHPKIIFADEPTGNLDYETGKIIEELLFGLNKDRNTTLLLVTHNTELSDQAHHIIQLKGGAIVKDYAKAARPSPTKNATV